MDDLLTSKEFADYYYWGDPNDKLGFDLEIMRVKEKVTQEELAKMMGTKQSSVARAEQSGCSFKFLMRAAQALNKYVEVIVKDV